MNQYRVALTGPTAETVVNRIERHHGEVTVIQICQDLAEIVALAGTGAIDAALLVETPEELSLTLIQNFFDHQVVLLVLSDDPLQRQRAFTLGAEALAADAQAEELNRCITHACQRGKPQPRFDLSANFQDLTPEQLVDGANPSAAQQPADTPTTGSGGEGAASTEREMQPGETISSQHWEPETGPGQVTTEAQQQPGMIYTFWGPAGSPGRSTIAANAAAEYALAQRRTLLIDADSYAASLSAILGLLEESSGLSQLCRLVELGAIDQQSFQRCVDAVEIAGKSFDVLSGLPHPQRWPELREAALAEILNQARKYYEVIIIDVAAPLEEDESLSFDVGAPQRNAASCLAVRRADKIFAIGAADVVQFSRLIKHSNELLQLAGAEAEIRFVINKVNAAATGGHAPSQLAYSWNRLGPQDHPQLHYLPKASTVVEDALLQGQTLAEHAPDHPLRLAIQELVDLPQTPPSRRWLQRPRPSADSGPNPAGNPARNPARGRRAQRRGLLRK